GEDELTTSPVERRCGTPRGAAVTLAAGLVLLRDTSERCQTSARGRCPPAMAPRLPRTGWMLGALIATACCRLSRRISALARCTSPALRNFSGEVTVRARGLSW